MSHCARRSVELGECDDGVKYYEAVWKPIVECTDPGSLTTYVMRLGHVVLKREWERGEGCALTVLTKHRRKDDTAD